MRLFLLGNCQAKALCEYLQNTPTVTTVFPEISYNYILDEVETWNAHAIDHADVFIYQHASAETLRSKDTSIVKANWTPAVIADRLQSKGRVTISFPSIYFAPYFPFAVSTQQAKSMFRTDVPSEAFPNWTMSQKLLDLVAQGHSEEEIVKQVTATDFISATELDAWVQKTFSNLKQREVINDVTIPLAEWLLQHWKRRRLMHITNHPTKYVFVYLLDRLRQVLQSHQIDLPQEVVNTPLCSVDQMEKSGAPPILPCVLQHFGLNDPSFGNAKIWIHGQEKKDWLEYVRFYVRARLQPK